MSLTRYATKRQGRAKEAPAALLVNGLGRIDPADSSLPWAVFNIEPQHCSTYRSLAMDPPIF
jgi:hypothetical protein